MANFNGRFSSQSQTSNFAGRYSTQATPPGNLMARPAGAANSVEFLKVQNKSETTRIAFTGLALSNDPATSDIQSCAYYLSALSAVYPALENVSKQVLRQIGHGTLDVTVDTAEHYFIQILEWIETPKLAVMIGQAVLLLYKNITEVGYRNFMIARTNAMKARAGFRGVITEDGDIVFSLEKAMMIRTRLGAFQILRAQVLVAQLVNQSVSGPMGGVSNYLCDILAWTDMAYMVFISDVLCDTKSPVLRDPRIQNEVRAFETAYAEINKTDSPQYYKILFPDKASKVVIKSKFPTLIAVAAECRAAQYGTVSRYVANLPSTNTLVAELVDMHNRYMRERSLVEQSEMVSYLTNVDPEDN